MTDSNIARHIYVPRRIGMALDPIHVGTGGTSLGRVDSTIVRDTVTRIPKIPGSSVAGVMRAYAAMAANNKYPNCAGQGQASATDEKRSGHCREAACPVCTVFGFANDRDSGGGFAGLAAFSDMQVLLFPVASQVGPQWITCPMAIRQGLNNDWQLFDELPAPNAIYKGEMPGSQNLGWLRLPVKPFTEQQIKLLTELNLVGIPSFVTKKIGIVSDKLFSHIVNSNLEVRTSVAIDPATGAAEAQALFTYEALPRATILSWEVTCRNPQHFRINNQEIDAVKTPQDVMRVVENAEKYLPFLGIGGMGTRGMGRLQVLGKNDSGGTE